jgi:hypothetical protein
MNPRILVPLWIFAVAICLSGCGGSYSTAPLGTPSPVSGKVMFADKTPLKGGIVYFKPVEVETGGKFRYEASGFVDAQGNYTIGRVGDGTGAVPGEYKVYFTTREIGELPGSNIKKVPAALQEPKTTTLTATVTEGNNKLDFEIK